MLGFPKLGHIYVRMCICVYVQWFDSLGLVDLNFLDDLSFISHNEQKIPSVQLHSTHYNTVHVYLHRN